MTIINLFFIPAVAVYIFYKLTNRKLTLDLSFLLAYMINCSVIAIITRAVLYCVRYLFEFEYVEVNSARYAVVSMAVSLIIPLLLKNFKATTKED